MNQKLRESVSALVDGEANELEIRRLLEREDFSEVRAAWSDYQRIGAGLDDATSTFAGRDISGAVSAAIAAESAPARSTTPAWLKPVGGVAVAASVAIAMVVGVNTLRAPTGNGVTGAAPVATSPVYSAQPGLQVKAGLTQGVDPGILSAERANAEAERKLEQYMLRHTERATGAGQGMIPFARVGDYEAE